MGLQPVKAVHPPHTVPQLGLARRGRGAVEAAGLRASAVRSRDDRQRLLEARGVPRERPRPLRRVPHAEGLADARGPRPLHGRRAAPGRGRQGAEPAQLVAREKYEDVSDLTLALQNGEELGYEDLSSGGMGRIQENLAKLPDSDVRAIAEYLLSLQ